MVAERTGTAITATYLRGLGLIARTGGGATQYDLQNAHGDVVALTGSAGAVQKRYTYDAFGNEASPSSSDPNPFRYCGEYFDKETGSYYLRARYYDPTVGRFTQQDTHWNTANMIYGDNPQKINKRQDALGLTTYTTVPQLSAILQSGNLYVYCVNNPVGYVDANGEFVITATTVLILGGAAIFGTIGGFIGNHIANQAGATGMKKAKYIVAGVCVGGILGGAVGTAAVPYAAAASFGGIAVTATGITVLGPAQQAAQIAAQQIDKFAVSAKHLLSGKGGYAHFASNSRDVINQWISDALMAAKNFSVNSPDSYITIVDMGQVIGSKGEHCIKIVFSTAGKIITAYPVK